MGFETENQTEDVTIFKIDRPKRYKVLMHNDDFTPMEFVVRVLMIIFRKIEAEAVRIMYKIHTEGCAVCGVYTKEIAETKVSQTIELARSNGFPLRCTMEEE